MPYKSFTVRAHHGDWATIHAIYENASCDIVVLQGHIAEQARGVRRCHGRAAVCFP